MSEESRENLLARIEDLENRLAESEQLIEAIKTGEVDAFALNTKDVPEIFTLQSGDYAYRILIEEFGEGAVNLSEDGMIVYTNTYFVELLHVTYEKVIGRYISDFIDPGSKQSFDLLFEKALIGKSKGEVNLNISNKTIPVEMSLTSLQPKLATVGIIITDQTVKKKHELDILRYQEDLELKNVELAQSNLELDSFTYIASHDLQEPLRKIQIFCSRITESTENELSATTQDYFRRILNASERMQNMISSLLNYSRVNIAHIERKETDLNEVLREVVASLLEGRKDSKINIETENLPSVLAIPQQMNQLFTNLISNAIKYRNKDKTPEIRIFSSLENGFWKITVADNGIGFEQQYADRIFELFRRLHTHFEYEGTGLGLAICKKIVQNHKGIIKAVGQPYIGSSFEIYLPVNSNTILT
jgi:PAS domain S-box-containing protein